MIPGAGGPAHSSGTGGTTAATSVRPPGADGSGGGCPPGGGAGGEQLAPRFDIAGWTRVRGGASSGAAPTTTSQQASTSGESQSKSGVGVGPLSSTSTTVAGAAPTIFGLHDDEVEYDAVLNTTQKIPLDVTQRIPPAVVPLPSVEGGPRRPSSKPGDLFTPGGGGSFSIALPKNNSKTPSSSDAEQNSAVNEHNGHEDGDVFSVLYAVTK